MGRGRKPKPTALKILEGNRGHRPIVEDAIQPPPQLPPAPAHLSERAKEHWDKIGTALYECGVLTTLDGQALELLITTYVEYLDASEKVVATGAVWMKPSEGKIPLVKMSPYWKIQQKSQALLLTLLREFGMTPVSRSSIKRPVSQRTEEDQRELRFFG